MRFPGWILRAVTVMAFFCGLLNAGEPATGIANVTAGFVTAITVTSGGSGYTSEPAVTISGGGGSGATAKAILSGDKVAVVVVLTAGSGYTSVPTLMIAEPAVQSWGTLRLATAVRIEGRAGQGLALERLLTTTWVPWTNVTVGAEWTEVVDLLQGADRSSYRSRSATMPATASAKLTAGFVTAITVTAGGEGYSQSPKVTLSGGGGSGATAQAILDGDKVGTVIVLTAGSGYSSVPSVKIDAPPSERELMSRLVPVLKLRTPLVGGTRIEVGRSIQGPWTALTNGWSTAGGSEVVDLGPDEQARFYRLQTNTSQAGPAGFVWIPAGTFVMGSPLSEPDRSSDEVHHTVTLTQGFWLSDHEVTQGEYLSVIGTNPSKFIGDLNRPVEQVSWDDAVLYCQKVTERERAAGRITGQQVYRLPTEAEWEYAARAGTNEARYGELDLIAWWSGNSGGQTHPVKQKQANAWGLHDVVGNVWEWCSDWEAPYSTTDQKDPTGPANGRDKVNRGGSYLNNRWDNRFSARASNSINDNNEPIGIRVVLASTNSGSGSIYSPSLVKQPEDIVLSVGQTASFSVVVTGTAPIAYQWQSNGMNLVGATQATLVITNAQLSSAGDYRVVVSNSAGSVTSAVAKLTVNPSQRSVPAGFVWIPAGTFVMGSPLSEPDRISDEVQHTVTLTQGFWLSDHEVTQGEYQSVMETNPSTFTGDLNRPVEQVSWDDAVLYCQKVTERERAAGRITGQQVYRLPTEAEWEYAARAGTNEARYGELDVIAWWSGNSAEQTHPVKQKAANAWGLYDMLGNVSEMCSDWYERYPTDSVTDPTVPSGPSSGLFGRVRRGNSWLHGAATMRSAKRGWIGQGIRAAALGFRPALSSELTVLAPTITAPPQSVTVTSGQTAQFTVTATATGPLSYQWQFNGMNLAGAMQATLVTTNAQLSSAGDYRVVVSNSAGSVSSVAAKLTVNPPGPLAGPLGFVWIPPGTFTMGSPTSEENHAPNESEHVVKLTMGYWILDHEVTQSEYLAVTGTNPSNNKGDNLPVEQVSWNDAVLYCQKLTDRERAAGRITEQQAYRLPTEAEWEYAARAGTTGARYGELDATAWWSGNSGERTHPVKQRAANAWGLHDMMGNVFEWCSDWSGDYPTGSVTDPIGPSSGIYRVLRGGSWNGVAWGARSAARSWYGPGGRINNLGFRPVLSSVR